MADEVRRDAGGRPITIDELIALNEEIVALTRAGVPLERGLLAAGEDLSGRLSEVATALGRRMSRGESLSEALAASGAAVPPVYRAVVEAGVRSGKLSNALESLATYARGFAEARRSILVAIWYPLLVLLVASVLFLGIMTKVIPRFVQTFEVLRLPLNWSLRLLNRLSETAWYWGPVIPVGLVLFVFAGLMSRRSTTLGARGAFAVLRWLPWTGSMLRNFEASSFAEMLALLVEHKVPYPEALALAGEASGDPRMAASSREIADAVARGQSPGEGLRRRGAFPPLLEWLLARGPREDDLVGSLRQMAGRYRSTARYRSETMRVLLPTVLLFGIGASATLLYALALFVPLSTLWSDLALQAP
jgi:general secretion pathway protein F